MRIKLYIFAILFAVTTVGFGQVEFTAKISKDQIGVNERLRIEFEMNKNGDNFTPPDFKNFKVYGGPRQAISRRWSNGKSKFSKTYTYYLQPERRGTFTIGQAKVQIDGKTYKTSPQTVKVTAAVNKPKNGDEKEIVDVSDQIHLVTEISNTSPYLNEGITVVYKLYVSKDAAVSNWHAIDIPKFSNFWNQDIQLDNYKVRYGSYKGDKDYRYVILKKTVLYPQKTGKLQVEPLTLNISIEEPTQRRNFFGQTIYKTVDKTMASKNHTIVVKSLPEKGKPDNFTGAVGQFDFKVTASKDVLDADESLDAKVVVSGNGNLKLFQLPELSAPKAFEVYDPEHGEKVNTNLNGMHGSISDTYTLVPKMKGKYKIKPLNFSYFDPHSKTYKRLASKPLKIDVKNGPVQPVSGGDSTGYTSTHKQPVTTSGKHFRYIKLKANLKPLDQAPFFKSKLFWTLLFLPLVILPVVVGFGNRHLEKANDLYGKRIKRADKLAKRYLSEAKKTLGDQKAYYDSLERALHNYLRAKLELQTSEMSKERIMELLKQKRVSEDTSRQFISLLESCEFARYTPSSDVGMKQDYAKAAKIISEVDKQMVKS